MHPLLTRVWFALNPSQGNGPVDRFKSLALVALCGLTALVQHRGLFEVPDWAFLAILGATALSLGVDMGFHEGRYEPPEE